MIRPFAFLVAAVALGACTSPARPVACPGDAVATLNFTGTLESDAGDPDAGNCPSVSDAGLSFTATIAYGPAEDAYLCVQKNEATPIPGQRDGGHLTLDAGAVAVTDACGCPLTLTEQVEGDVVRDADGGVTGFDGELSDALATVDGGTAGCERDAGTTPCGVSCVARWRLTSP